MVQLTFQVVPTSTQFKPLSGLPKNIAKQDFWGKGDAGVKSEEVAPLGQLLAKCALRRRGAP